MNNNYNYFSLFSLPVSYEVNEKQLKHSFRTLQKTMHPDNFASKSGMEKVQSMQHAAEINDAFKTLSDPYLRGRYLLELMNFQFKENDTISDSGFLMEQMELRENLEAAKNSDDPLLGIEELLDVISDLRLKLIEHLSELFSSDLVAMDVINQELMKLQFYNKLQEEVGVNIDELDS